MKKVWISPNIEELDIKATQWNKKSSKNHDFETWDLDANPDELVDWGGYISGEDNSNPNK